MLFTEGNVAFHSGKPGTVWLKKWNFCQFFSWEWEAGNGSRNCFCVIKPTDQVKSSNSVDGGREGFYPDLKEGNFTCGLITAKRTARWKRTDCWRLKTALDIPALLNLHSHPTLNCGLKLLDCSVATSQYHCSPTRRQLAPHQRGSGRWSQRESFPQTCPLSSSEIPSQPHPSWSVGLSQSCDLKSKK